MTSQLPPKRRDTKDRGDLIRHLRTNASQLGVGFMGGRFPPLRPLGSSALIGEIEDDGAGAGDVMWEWDDRLTVTTAGAQTFTLSHVPVEESLVVRWHPDGGAPLTQVNERWTLDGQTVTIPDAGSDIEAGDVFSAQYQYEPGVVDADSPLTPIGSDHVYAVDPSLDPPEGSAVGDFIVITTITGTIDDDRVTLLADHDGTGSAHFYTYAGTLTSLAPFTPSAGPTAAAWAVFRAPTMSSFEVFTASTSPVDVPSVASRHAILVAGARNGVASASINCPTEYTSIVASSDLPHSLQLIAYWDPAVGAGPSPATTATGFWDDFLGVVIGVTNFDSGIDGE